MNLVDVELLYFLPPVWLLYWLLPRRVASQNLILLLASCVFYAAWSKTWLAWLLFSATLDWWVALRLQTLTRPGDDETDAAAQSLRARRRMWFAISLTANLSVLATAKYLGASVELLSQLLTRLGIAADHSALSVVLPLGISYYTLQKIGYVVDVYWGRQSAERSWLRFALFSSFFAHITAGPISRANELLPQLHEPRRLAPDVLARGAGEFLGGYVLKAFAANVLGLFLVNPVFDAPAEFNMLSAWVGTFGFALQVFCDFAGYSLLAIGTARLFGLVLPTNFRLPFLSCSLPEFWRRWHITLNQWLFDYIYTPLVTGRGAWRGRFVPALYLVFMISGIWHGSTWTFVLWGLLHGFGMAVHFRWDEYYKRLCRGNRSWVARRRTLVYTLASWALTQVFFVITLVPFRATSLAGARELVAGLLGAGGERGVFGEILSPLDKLGVLLAVAVPIGWHLLGLPRLGFVQRLAARVPAPLRGVAYGLVCVALLVLVPVGTSTFIYRNF